MWHAAFRFALQEPLEVFSLVIMRYEWKVA